MPRPTATLPSYDDALARVLAVTPVLGTERVSLAAAAGRVLRESVRVDRDQPPFDRAAMDGFAVRAAAVRGGGGRAWPIVGEVPAGGRLERAVDASREVVRIATGAAVPEPFDAVIPIEQAKVEGERVTFAEGAVAKLEPWRNVHRRGSDARAGDVIVHAGTRLAAHHLGLAAAAGVVELTVTQRPRVALLTTGHEVRDPATPTDQLAPEHIRNSNGPMLAALVNQWGGELVDQRHVIDDPEATLAAARDAMSHAHLVLTTGGVSVGGRDLLPWAWQRLGLRTLLHGVNIQPGKPLLVALEPADGVSGSEFRVSGPPGEDETGSEVMAPLRGPASDQPESRSTKLEAEPATRLVLGLPGNPVSVLATARLFAQPVLRRMLGLPASLPWRRVWLAEPVQPNPRRQAFRAARYVGETREQVTILPWQGSGDLAHTAPADGFVRLPIQADPLPPGTPLPLLEW